jgi:hypothetical protein
MKKSVKKLLFIALGAFGVAANQTSMADQATCNSAGCTTANLPVTFTIVIPAFLRLQVGAVGSNADVQWATAVTSANIGTGQVNADTVTNGGAGAGLVAYALVSNVSANDATITATGSAAAFTSGGNSIPYTDVNATANGTTGAAVALPVPGTPTTVTPTSGLINRAGTWQYFYLNNTIYPAGSYTGTINYTATQP